jgi:hypothetical protein
MQTQAVALVWSVRDAGYVYLESVAAISVHEPVAIWCASVAEQH